MKAKLFYLSIIALLLSACTTRNSTQAQVYIYAEIPLAPDVVVAVGTSRVASPGSDFIWIDGHWTWDSRFRQYVWIQGYWAVAPFAGAYWIPGFWESRPGGFFWVSSQWIPRNQRLHFGYSNGRYDYFGRPVFYQQPRRSSRSYAFGYDHNPDHRAPGFNSSASFNRAPASDRTRINQENRNPQPAPTVRSTQSRTAAESSNIRNSTTNRSSVSTETTRSSSQTIENAANRNQSTRSDSNTSNSGNSSRSQNTQVQSSDRNDTGTTNRSSSNTNSNSNSNVNSRSSSNSNTNSSSNSSVNSSSRSSSNSSVSSGSRSSSSNSSSSSGSSSSSRSNSSGSSERSNNGSRR